MHANSLHIMKAFIKNYVPDQTLTVLDIGSRVVPRQAHIGSYRVLFNNPKWHYTGCDIEDGDNVDVVCTSPDVLPFADGTFNVVVSGQTLEHVEHPWLLITEAARVMASGGVCCFIAPAVIHEHRYPIDTYRYYPDGLKALARWAGLTPLETKRIVINEGFEDTYLFASKP